MNDYFLEGAAIVKHFLDDIDSLAERDYDRLNLGFYNDNFEKLLFYVSKSFLSSNFDELFDRLDDEVPKNILLKNTKSFSDNEITFLKTAYFTKNLYCKLPDCFNNSPKLAYKQMIRNCICHFKFQITNGIVMMDNSYRGQKLHGEISVASLVLLMQNTLTSYGMSKNEGAYEYTYFLSPVPGQSYILMIKNLANNKIAPSDLVKMLKHHSVNTHFRRLPPRSRSVEATDKLIRGLGIGRYYVRSYTFDSVVMKKANIATMSDQNDVNLYLCAFDDIKRTSIAYNKIIDLLFILHERDLNRIGSDFIDYWPIIGNAVFISYLSLVFNDSFVKRFSGSVNSKLFNKKTEIDDSCVPSKFRNSLAHSRYHFEDVFNSKGDSVVEFWDEYDGIVNFKCKITKDNAIQFSDDCIKQSAK